MFLTTDYWISNHFDIFRVKKDKYHLLIKTTQNSNVVNLLHKNMYAFNGRDELDAFIANFQYLASTMFSLTPNLFGQWFPIGFFLFVRRLATALKPISTRYDDAKAIRAFSRHSIIQDK